ncbi:MULTISPECIES: UDP-N-acetylmuramate dehydrogenase [Aneurinibacillus]|uniref:UDP-N-acetylenolpyruvoylglucosamine reductase n=1 Tax=Aneurinibacillus thermoaerophilus TaxID=143495 RepID=A0A1G7W8J4_ANETH|nr:MULTISPECIES: UDP-N-acetylmuramate dehydrogenase [Aneurinibacillus]AMA72572.1 UDP-N-acetylenolpyruvoylglucosamine reductase [Aneurinibacillus sp. XH2]MED0674721.1 UDP-N-acetylmuramate dehydrogenase [Aneurinibacillus thermoaerophilus]MED0680204.1 UDP-N-acetylmuramate dehydrogenase [Aneurinibacillus thermoaerophilus]MED0736847.1 UDP-N-acetylmuramate dehydrogenase [Aneurinibacillus thermoaerophilus]MED0756688.1 UDP-N-acetylmuramate dehydrogenase [Aneurinibacillus thermoaerophilus]
MQELIRELKEANIGTVLINEPLANHTTWKIGGPADILVEPTDKMALARSMKLVHKHNVPWYVLGRGSNMLVRDRGIRGVVFKLADGFNHLAFNGEEIEVGAGYSFIRLAVMAGKEGLTGLEFAGGIPGTVGGAIYMNAGAHNSDVSRILKSAEVLLETGELVIFSADELGFSYRTSILQKRRGIVVSAVFKLAYGDRKEIARHMAAYKDRRRQTQPLSLPCAGSVFRNPPGDHAGRLIESAGLKGLRVGGAQISEKHANFIVNRGNATAQDVLDLMEQVIKIVNERYNIKLVPEVLVVGEG